MRAIVIVDLGFGDAGKGLLTDFLVRRTGARSVVRYNGGAQAGHNVVTPDGRHHTFSQFGSGTFVPGVRTFLSSDVVVHPTALLREAAALRSAGVADALERLHVSGDAPVITPYHQALGRLREIARGTERHGSCGVGVGEAVDHAHKAPLEVIRVRHLADIGRLRRMLPVIRERALAEVDRLDVRRSPDPRANLELEILDRADVAEKWARCAAIVGPLAADENAWIPHSDERSTVIFEGSQGVLLDEGHGFHPYTSWSRCTSSAASALISQFSRHAEISTIGVLRTFAVRHGPGPLPTETAAIMATPGDHNTSNDWQGAMRRGWFDGRLARYAIDADGGIDALAITHLDWLSRIDAWKYCTRYSPDVRIESSCRRSLEERERLTIELTSARPLLSECAAREDEVTATIEEITGKPVIIGSRGPSSKDVFVRSSRSTMSSVVSRIGRQFHGGEAWRSSM